MAMMDTDFSVVGHFRVKVVDPDGSVVHDTGPVRNVVTGAGVELFFWKFCDATTGGWTLGDWYLTTQTGAASHFGLGTGGGSGVAFTDTTLNTEYAYDSPDTRAAFTSKTADMDISESEYSILTLTGTFPAGFVTDATTASINEVGIFNHVSNTENCLAHTKFTTISVTSSQEVQVTYTISFKQAAIVN